MTQIGHLIPGFVPPAGAPVTPVYNPATGEQSGAVLSGGKAEVDAAVAAAAAAFPAWSALTPLKRARVMFRYKDLLEKNADAIARAISAEHGKTHPDALGEVQRGLEVVEFACGIPQMLKGEFSRDVGPDIDSFSTREALGVVAGITPFNFPAMVPLWMFPMALACGNTFVLKPSERDPSATNLIVQLAHEAGVPDGALVVVHGGKPAVDALLTHPDVMAVSFVGSTPIAEYVYATGTAHGKRVQALGGAKNHMLVMPDADIDQAADALMGAGYGSAGERCMAVSVAVPVGEKTADALIEALTPRVRALKIGPSTDPAADMGPLVTAQHLAKVSGYIDAGVREGAELVVDGRGLKLQGYENGYFLGGSLFDRVTPDMSIYREEIFGPVLSVVRAASFDEAVGLIRRHEYGNGTAIFTRDGDSARAFVNQVNVGMIGVNVPIPVPVAYHSFGGWKRSSFGSHGIYGPEGVHFYTRLKTVTSRWPTGIRAGASFAFPT
ncbi:CoA-acylating methylmalonate-semialdehyde dehydrogenase [Novispirillum itersonii]|uniref:methylmalonate-semialdehyde dehydrogenase (CoA acylating) n=1 Tax=Novispirillum itersonii TaxID=189 RepID=A0A7W9ZL11_NOVIT|nr:CoA-acylating methylmalonate-semialdehyde dehydrogenase [Novispirillum itersonii]MBB6212457.1 malonate-semialdehyde dehydrogenase (acetylating)/methylmalonate-semialdehyde dehydrogenase [Novispirillum itersonii]